MNTRLKQVNRVHKLKLAAASGAIVVGATYLILKSFPHLRTSFYDYLSGNSHDNEEDEVEDNVPIELSDSPTEEFSTANLGELSLVDVGQWSDDNLKNWLHSVSSIDQIPSISDTNITRKKSVLHPMLLMITLFPLLSQFKKLLVSYNIMYNINFTQLFVRILITIQKFLTTS